MTQILREIHTKSLFVSLLPQLVCDLILDVGSRDGQEALIFKKACPQAAVVAIEANPYNARRIARDRDVLGAGVEVESFAAWCEDGRIRFNVADYERDPVNLGTSSILAHSDIAVREVVEVRCARLDTFLARRADGRRVAVWMDVEGAEYQILAGLADCLDRVVMVHVEVARIPQREGQRGFDEVDRVMRNLGFLPVGSNFDGRDWGDVLYVKRDVWSKRSPSIRLAYRTAWLMRAFPRRRVATFLFETAPWLHRRLKRKFRMSKWLSGY